MNIKTAKGIVKNALLEYGLNNRVTARTVSFSDLGREECVFVCVHNWTPSPLAGNIIKVAKENGFCVEFSC